MSKFIEISFSTLHGSKSIHINLDEVGAISPDRIIFSAGGIMPLSEEMYYKIQQKK